MTCGPAFILDTQPLNTTATKSNESKEIFMAAIETKSVGNVERILALAGLDATRHAEVERQHAWFFEVLRDENLIGFFIVIPNGQTAELHTHLPTGTAREKL